MRPWVANTVSATATVDAPAAVPRRSRNGAPSVADRGEILAGAGPGNDGGGGAIAAAPESASP